MKFLITVLFFIGSVHMAYSQIKIDPIYYTLATKIPLILEYDLLLAGYNPYLTAEQVLRFDCANPTDKIFNTVHFNDTNMETQLDMTKPFGFVTHGWLDNAKSIWIKELSETWINHFDMNVCRVDYSVYSMVLLYPYAAVRTAKVVAGFWAKFIMDLHAKYNVDYNNVTLLGHSLGGEIIGLTGSNLGGQVGRIIAMDPAGPYYTFPTVNPVEDRLDKSDAKFVTVLHSNNYVEGVGFSIGHADYYINGRFPIQPGCIFPLLFGIYAEEVDPIQCSHYRAVRIAHLAMYNNPLCLAVKCDTHEDYLNRNCTNTTDTWGLNSAKIEGDFYFWTGFDPKCLNKYWPFE